MNYRRMFMLTASTEAMLDDLARSARKRRARSATIRAGIVVLAALHGYVSPQNAAALLCQLWPDEQHAMAMALCTMAEVLDGQR